MTTLITWGNSAGEVRRCDERCHGARGGKCDCICGGAFHGVARRPDCKEIIAREGARVFVEACRRARESGGWASSSVLDQLTLFEL
jgi:hypothetical protein